MKTWHALSSLACGALLCSGVGAQTSANTQIGQVLAHLAPKTATTMLTGADWDAIGQQLPAFQAAAGQLVDSTCHQDTRPNISFVDLNGDGQPEVLINAGNDCLDGPTGTELNLLAKLNGRWHTVLHVTASELATLPTHGREGWADLRIAGRSACEGWWRFNGEHYQVVGKINSQGQVCR